MCLSKETLYFCKILFRVDKYSHSFCNKFLNNIRIPFYFQNAYNFCIKIICKSFINFHQTVIKQCTFSPVLHITFAWEQCLYGIACLKRLQFVKCNKNMFVIFYNSYIKHHGILFALRNDSLI